MRSAESTDGFDLGRNRHRLAVGVLRGDRDRVVAVGPLQAARVLAVPGEGLACRRSSSSCRCRPVWPVALLMLTVAGGGLGHRRDSRWRVPLDSGAVAPSTADRLADELERGGVLRGLLQRDQRGELVVGLELLLDLRELHELRGELVGVERIERVLVLELRGEQRQEGLEVAGDACPCPRRWRWPWRWSSRVGRGAPRRPATWSRE